MPEGTSRRPSFRTLLIAGAVSLGAIGVIVAIALRRPPPERALPIQARLELAAGPVDVDQGAGATRAVSGSALHDGAVVTTAKGARALVRLPDGSSLFLRDGTKVKLGTDALELAAGEYWVDAPPNDRKPLVHRVGGVELSAADAGLSVRREGDAVSVYVARGMASVSGEGGRVEVHAGEQAQIAGKGAPAVTPVAFWDDWTGGMADLTTHGMPGAGVGAIYGVDEGAPGARAKRLEIKSQSVRAVLREGLAETSVDQTFFNPAERSVEGWYWFTVPERASITGFAVETNGVLVEGEFVEKKEAAAKYGAAKSSGFSPAILEWVDARTYRARIYPITGGGTRRVRLRYVELAPASEGRLAYTYPMGARGEPMRIGEFSLSVDLGDEGKKMKLSTLADARVEEGGRKVTMRRSGFTPRADFQLEASVPTQRPPLTVARRSAGGDSADYVLARWAPDVAWADVKQQRADVVVVVDTSAAGDESSRQLAKETAQAILRSLSDEDRFALVSLDVKATVLHPKDALAPASEAEIAKALEGLAEHPSGGATDLSAAFEPALARLHGAEQPAVVYVGDGIATSGEMTGAALVERLRRALSTSRARLFTVGVGTDADHALLGELARAGGGQELAVSEAGETTARALDLAAAIKAPTITDLDMDFGAGLDDAFSSAAGKVQKGEEVVLLARTHHELAKRVKVKFRLAGKDVTREYDAQEDKSVLGAFVPRLWASEYVRRLLGSGAGPDAERGRIVSLGLDYGLLTPFTSILALESEAAYSIMGVPRRSGPLRGVTLGALDVAGEHRLLDSLSPPVVSMAGCSKSDRFVGSEAAPVSQSTEAQSNNKEGGYGTRAKGEEGSMGAPASPAAAAPAPPAERELDAKDAPEQFARSGGGGVPRDEDDGRALKQDRAAAARPAAIGALEEKAKSAVATAPGLAAAKPPSGPSRSVVATPVTTTQICSDAAERPLAERVLLWKKRIKTARTPAELVERYEAARRACELEDWRAERTFLELLQKAVIDEGAVAVVLGHFAGRPDVQKFIAKLILRRTVSDQVIAAVERVVFGSAIDWVKVDNELAEVQSLDERLTQLRQVLARAPDDPNGGVRLVKLLVQSDKKDEALALGRRLRDSGLLTPLVARQIGDVLARASLADEAVRTYSEIVEFDPESLPSRRLLGDIYLAHGWYDPAYRQFLTLTTAAPTDGVALLRLAAAAAGSGRVDEALRLERQVASAQGTPGPSDPRRWARLSSAARIARLLAEPPAPLPGAAPVDPARRREALIRELKELGLFASPGTLVLLTWEALDADLALAARVDKKDIALGEQTDAAPVGVAAAFVPTAELAAAELVARLRSPRRDDAVALRRHDLVWDGKTFQVTVKAASLAASSVEQAL